MGKDTLEGDIIHNHLIFILQDEAGFTLILLKICMATHTSREVLKGLDLPKSDIGILAATCHVSHVFTYALSESKGPNRIHVT